MEFRDCKISNLIAPSRNEPQEPKEWGKKVRLLVNYMFPVLQ
jgi:hypothetical protein